jgi:hypothetical protein
MQEPSVDFVSLMSHGSIIWLLSCYILKKNLFFVYNRIKESGRTFPMLSYCTSLKNNGIAMHGPYYTLGNWGHKFVSVSPLLQNSFMVFL